VELIRKSVEVKKYKKARVRQKKIGFTSFWEKRREPREEENQEKGELEIL